jgi:formylmethanofuran dehydrogenase subunit E
MSLTEKAAYLRGLADGMKLGEKDTDESKLLLAIVDVLNDVAANVESNNDSITTLADEVDELDDVVTSLEENLYDEDDDLDDLDDMDEEDMEDVEYELDCPECGEPVVLDEETISSGEVICPHCHKKLSIDVGFEDEEDEE